MSDDKKKDMYSRRGFLGIGSAALAAAGMLSVADAAGQEQHPYPTKNDKERECSWVQAIPRWMPKIRSLSCRLPPTQAACRRSSTLSDSPTNGCKRVDGHAKSRSGSLQVPSRLPAWT